MRQLSEEKILANWNRLIKLIEDTFDEERKDNLLEMYKYFEDRMSVAPASGKAAYHIARYRLCFKD
jgi:Trp operon repressor